MLKTDRIRLRKLKETDVGHAWLLFQDPHVLEWTIRFSAKPRRKDIETLLADPQRLAFGIFLGKTFVGIAEIFDRQGGLAGNDHSPQAEVGYWLLPAYWGRGIALEALLLLKEYAFSELGLHRLQATCYAKNARSRRVLEKGGFRLEGTRKGARVKDGAWYDELLFAVTDA